MFLADQHRLAFVATDLEQVEAALLQMVRQQDEQVRVDAFHGFGQ